MQSGRFRKSTGELQYSVAMAVVAGSWVVRPACAPRGLAAQKAIPEPTASCSCTLRPNRASQQLKSRSRRVPLLSRGSVVRVSNGDDNNMDDEGVVKDMERYLNELSVEYENVWDTKPFWCQPWTIVLTGVTGISLSWLVIKSTLVTGIVTALVAAWWYLFLYTYPLAYTDMIAERRRKQRNGTEDTYGLRTRKEL